MDFLEDIATDPSNRLCVECLSLLDGDETFCPNCGLRISIAYAIGSGVSNADYLVSYRIHKNE